MKASSKDCSIVLKPPPDYVLHATIHDDERARNREAMKW